MLHAGVSIIFRGEKLLRGQLREYQEVALDWLVAMDKVKKHLPAVLGDVSGLDRRVTTAALFAHLAAEI